MIDANAAEVEKSWSRLTKLERKALAWVGGHEKRVLAPGEVAEAVAAYKAADKEVLERVVEFVFGIKVTSTIYASGRTRVYVGRERSVL